MCELDDGETIVPFDPYQYPEGTMTHMNPLLVFLVAFSVDPPEHWTYGPNSVYTFCPTVIVRAPDSPVASKLWIPIVHENAHQRIISLHAIGAGGKLPKRFDDGGLNSFLLFDRKSRPLSKADCGYRALVSLRSMALDASVARRQRHWTLTETERAQTGRFLSLTESTGLKRADWRARASAYIDEEGHPVLMARKLFDAVIDRLEYRRGEGFKGPHRAWDERIGECTDYAAVFVALCRAAGLPARAVVGYEFLSDHWEMHVWAEFYIAGVGWAPCDPSRGDGGPADDYFAALSDNRLAVTRDYDLNLGSEFGKPIPVLQQYVYRYEGVKPPTFEWRLEGECLGHTPLEELKRRFDAVGTSGVGAP